MTSCWHIGHLVSLHSLKAAVSSGERISTEVTVSVCPPRLHVSSPFSKSQTFTVVSRLKTENETPYTEMKLKKKIVLRKIVKCMRSVNKPDHTETNGSLGAEVMRSRWTYWPGYASGSQSAEVAKSKTVVAEVMRSKVKQLTWLTQEWFPGCWHRSQGHCVHPVLTPGLTSSPSGCVLLSACLYLEKATLCRNHLMPRQRPLLALSVRDPQMV